MFSHNKQTRVHNIIPFHCTNPLNIQLHDSNYIESDPSYQNYLHESHKQKQYFELIDRNESYTSSLLSPNYRLFIHTLLLT